MDQWLDEDAAEYRKLASLFKIQYKHSFRCCFSGGPVIWNNHIVRSLQSDSRWKSRRIDSAPSGQSFVSDFLAFANRQSRRRQATLHATHTHTTLHTQQVCVLNFEFNLGLPSCVQQLCLRPDSDLNSCYVPRESVACPSRLSHLFVPYLSPAIVRLVAFHV